MTHNPMQHNAMQRITTSHTFFSLCLYAWAHTACHCTFLKGREKKNKTKTSVIRGAEAAKSNHWASWELPCLDWEPLDVPRRARGALTLHSFFPDTNQIQQHKHIQGSVCVCARVCVKARDGDSEADIKSEGGKHGRRQRELGRH